MIRTFVVYLPTGDKFIKAEAYRVHYEDDIVVFYNTEDISRVPVAHFILHTIYGWGEYNA